MYFDYVYALNCLHDMILSFEFGGFTNKTPPPFQKPNMYWWVLFLVKLPRILGAYFDMIVRQKSIFECQRLLHAHLFSFGYPYWWFILTYVSSGVSHYPYVLPHNFYYFSVMGYVWFVTRHVWSLLRSMLYIIESSNLSSTNIIWLEMFFMSYLGVIGFPLRNKHW